MKREYFNPIDAVPATQPPVVVGSSLERTLLQLWIAQFWKPLTSQLVMI